MNHLPYRAIALDLDGTLTNHDKVVTPKTREALLQAEAKEHPYQGENALQLITLDRLAKKLRAARFKNVEEIIETLRPHIRDISFRTYYRKRREAIEALSSVLWGYTSKDSLDMLEQFFPETKSPSGQSGSKKAPG